MAIIIKCHHCNFTTTDVKKYRMHCLLKGHIPFSKGGK